MQRYHEQLDDHQVIEEFDQPEESLPPEDQQDQHFERIPENHEQLYRENEATLKRNQLYTKNPMIARIDDGYIKADHNMRSFGAYNESSFGSYRTPYLKPAIPASKASNSNFLQHHPRNERARESPNLDIVQKLEYRRILELQILEKQMKKSHDNMVQKLEDEMEQLRAQTEKMKTELEKNAANKANEKNALGRNKLIVNSSFVASEKPDRVQKEQSPPLRKYQETRKEHQSKRETLTNYEIELEGSLPSSQRFVEYQSMKDNSRRNTPEYFVLQQEIVKLREELRENTRMLQGQIAEIKVDYLNTKRLTINLDFFIFLEIHGKSITNRNEL